LRSYSIVHHLYPGVPFHLHVVRTINAIRAS